MGDTIGGSFPGGPSRPDSGSGRGHSPDLRTVSEMEEGLARRKVRRASRRRARRILFGFVAAALLAGVMGAWMGFRAHTTPQQMTAEQEVVRQQDKFISREVNRTLLQLWKMEDIEDARNSGKIR